MTNNLQERRSVAAGQVDAMLDTLSENKIQRITELFDKTVLQENLDETNLTEEWEGYHDWLTIRTGSAYALLSQPGNGKHKLDASEAVNEEEKVEADLEDESKASRETTAETTGAEVLAPASQSEENPAGEEVDDEPVAPVEAEAHTEDEEPVADEKPHSFFAADDEDEDDLEDDEADVAPAQQSATGRVTVNDVLQKEFTIEKLRGGYNEDDVDDFLDDIAAFLNESHTNAELDEKIEAVEGHGFRRKKLGSGCKVEEVDDFLDEIVEELKARKN